MPIKWRLPSSGAAILSFAATVCFTFNCSAAIAHAASPLDATYDARLNDTCVSAPAWPEANEVLAAYHAPIPKTIFQVWFGGDPGFWRGHLWAWESYAAKFGYAYRLYTDDDITEILAHASADIKKLWDDLWRARQFRGISDLARFLILLDQGGIYIDADMRVPRWDGLPVDFADFMPLRGFVVVADGAPVDWGVGGLHVLTGIMASCPGHRTLKDLLAQLPNNALCCARGGQSSTVLSTGPVPLTVLLSSPVTVVPTLFWDPLGVPDPEWR